MKTVSIVYATPERQLCWRIELADGATIDAALGAARALAADLAVPWDAEVGIFGELTNRETVPRDGDRIEIYRPLKADPKEARRARARRVQQVQPARPRTR